MVDFFYCVITIMFLQLINTNSRHLREMSVFDT